jgi:hypothetical protein
VDRIASWNGTSWSALASGMNGKVAALRVFDDGSGEALYAGGTFTVANAVPANRIAKWNGTSWSPLGTGVSGSFGLVSSLAVFDDGSGEALYAGGQFTTAGGVAASHIAKWNGTSWSALGAGVGGFPSIDSLTVFDDGGGAALYAGGNFTTAGGAGASNIAKWNGTSWSALGSGMNDRVFALTVFDDGGGAALYAGGEFTTAGGVSANHVAKWNGTSWSALGSGVSTGVNPAVVYALAVFDDGGGPALYAGGKFAIAGGGLASHIAKWNGTTWSALGSGVNDRVNALTVFDDGSGEALYAGGLFTTAGGVPASRIARWNGSSWSALGSSGSEFDELGFVYALTVFDDGVRHALYAGGDFTLSAAGDSYLAKWGCPAIDSVPGCAGNPAVLAALATSAPLGMALPLQVTGFATLSGLARVYAGAPGLDPGGCGLLLPGLGELLLALTPPPLLIAEGGLAGGISALNPLVPSIPVLAGITFYLEGLAVDLTLPHPLELTNALAVTLGP